jgi:hypothetical protein
MIPSPDNCPDETANWIASLKSSPKKVGLLKGIKGEPMLFVVGLETMILLSTLARIRQNVRTSEAAGRGGTRRGQREKEIEMK